MYAFIIAWVNQSSETPLCAVYIAQSWPVFLVPEDVGLGENSIGTTRT